MIHRQKLSACCAIALSLLCSSFATAQQPAANAQPAAAAQPPAAAAPAQLNQSALITNPAVLAATEWPRTRPADALSAVLVLVDLDRPDIAKPILDELQARQLTQADRASLVAAFGSHRMLQLARNSDLAPTGADFAEACMAAASAAATDPNRLTQLVSQLADPSAEARVAARSELVAAGQAGVRAVLEALGREQNPAQRQALIAAAEQMQPLVVAPLLALLDTKDVAIRNDVAALLAQLHVFQAAPLISAFSSPNGEADLSRALADYQKGTPPFAADGSNQVVMWHWDDTAKTLSAAAYPADAARIIWMARLAKQLSQLQPTNRTYLRRAVLLNLEAAGLSAAAQGAPMPSKVRLEGADGFLLNQVLSDALANNYSHAAVAACAELGRRGDASVLLTADGKLSPLATALTNASRRVRFAALSAIITLDPASPYPGSSKVAEALEYFTQSAGKRGAIVAMPTALAATDVAGKLAPAGYEAEATNNGRDVAGMAARMADLEIVLIDMDLFAPDVRQVLFELRTVTPAGQVPVALLAADGRLEAAQSLAAEHDRVFAISRPHSIEAVAKIAARLRELAPADEMAGNLRAMEAVQAITWTANLLEKHRNFYVLRRGTPAIEAALFQPAATKAAITALARFGTPESQRALARVVGLSMLPIETRREAAAAFDQSVKAHGVLLTTDEIVSQYSIYNASAASDADTQQVLGTLLDSIEQRRATTANIVP